MSMLDDDAPTLVFLERTLDRDGLGRSGSDRTEREPTDDAPTVAPPPAYPARYLASPRPRTLGAKPAPPAGDAPLRVSAPRIIVKDHVAPSPHGQRRPAFEERPVEPRPGRRRALGTLLVALLAALVGAALGGVLTHDRPWLSAASPSIERERAPRRSAERGRAKPRPRSARHRGKGVSTTENARPQPTGGD